MRSDAPIPMFPRERAICAHREMVSRPAISATNLCRATNSIEARPRFRVDSLVKSFDTQDGTMDRKSRLYVAVIGRGGGVADQATWRSIGQAPAIPVTATSPGSLAVGGRRWCSTPTVAGG